MSQAAKLNNKNSVKAKSSSLSKKAKTRASHKTNVTATHNLKPKTSSFSNTKVLPDGTILNTKTITKKGANSVSQLSKFQAKSEFGNAKGVSFTKEERDGNKGLFHSVHKSSFMRTVGSPTNIASLTFIDDRNRNNRSSCGCL